MGRRSEQRIAVSLPVTVRGLNSYGAPFEVETETRDISFSGACLDRLNDVVSLGAKIELESNGRRAWYRVAWKGQPGSADASLIGIRSLEYDRYIWGIAPKGWEPDLYDVPTSGSSNSVSAMTSDFVHRWHGPERRQFARRACDIDVEVASDDGSKRFRCRITEISLGGCVVNLSSPLPRGTTLSLSFVLDGIPVEIQGTINAPRGGQGFGVAFTSMSPVAFVALRKFAPPAIPPQSPHSLHPASSANSTANVAESVDAILNLLQRKGVLTAAEFAEETEKLKHQRPGMLA